MGEAGAHWPSTGAEAGTTATSEAWTITDEDRAFWAFRPVQDPPAPAVKDAAWARSPIDRFVLAKLEEKGLRPVAPGRQGDADPPRDLRPDRPAADARGGRGLRGRHVARGVRPGGRPPAGQPRTTASAGGGTGSTWPATARTRPTRSSPASTRTGSSIATGWPPPSTPTCPTISSSWSRSPATCCRRARPRLKRLPALGFFALGPVYYGDRKEFDQIDDRIDTLTRGFLGLTVACARCHDHKFDPIPTRRLLRPGGRLRQHRVRGGPLRAPRGRSRPTSRRRRPSDPRNARSPRG